MIGKLSGIFDEKYEDHLILEVNGVGYVVYTTPRLLSTLPTQGARISLYIETYMREDSLRLYGFSSLQEKEWFLLLQTVQGVGAKSALAILNTFLPLQLSQAIALRDVTSLCRAQGVGKRVAERIVTELKNKAPSALATPSSPSINLEDLHADAALDALSALSNLGYPRELAASAVQKALIEAGQSADAAKIIRLSLQELAR
ncbi:Holliday junction branch migration protein RuvA [Bartonella sp. DGB2]|uniref:Holliday junction branch migration protein RuvA n=1 Tax=Bartonella sp. DGB2 TaxID=3388426 RepID=UPI00398FA325